MDGTTGTISYSTILNLDSTTEIEMNTALLDVDATTLEMDGTTGTISYTTILNLDSTTEIEMGTALLDVDATSLTMDGTDAVITYPTIDLVASTDVDIDTPKIDLSTQYLDIDLIASTTMALSIDSDLMSFDSNQRRVGISTNDPYHKLEIYEGSLNFNLVDGEAGIIWNDDATDEMRLYRTTTGKSDLFLDQWNGSALITDFVWSNEAVLLNTMTANDSSILHLQAQAVEDEALLVFGAGALLTSPQWYLGYENSLFMLYDSENTKYAFTVAPDTCHIKLWQDEQKIIFYDDETFIASKGTDLQIFDENYDSKIFIKAKSDPAVTTTSDASVTIGPTGSLDNTVAIDGHTVELVNGFDTGYVSASTKFKACEKFYVTGSPNVDDLNYGTIEDGGGVVVFDLDFAETYSQQSKAINSEELVQFAPGESSWNPSYVEITPSAYNHTYRSEFKCSNTTGLFNWTTDCNESAPATLNDSDMLYNYSSLGYVQHIKQAPFRLVAGYSVPGPWNMGAYERWYDGGLH
jgi:hypothetical protein